MEKLANDFLDYILKQKKYSSNTFKNYSIDIDEFKTYLKKEGVSFFDVDYDFIKGYLMYLYDKKLSRNSIARKLSSLRSFYKYLLNNNVVETNPFLLISLPKKEKHLPRFFYYNELEELFKTPDIRTPLGQRDRLLLEILYATGVRVSELVNIKVSDISGFEILILGKGDKERVVRFGDYANEILELYLSNGYKKLNVNGTKFLFLNNQGGQLTTRGVRYILNKIIEQTTIDNKISPHMLRHTFATHLLNEGCDLLTVQELLGHASLSATSIYTHITNDRLKEVYFRCHPRAKK